MSWRTSTTYMGSECGQTIIQVLQLGMGGRYSAKASNDKEEKEKSQDFVAVNIIIIYSTR